MSSNTSYDASESPAYHVSGAFGAVLGYIGAEAAKETIFQRLLWPQRFFSGFDVFKAPKMALCLSMAGPLHKAALATLDGFRKNRLFQGRQHGYMLGTAFMHETHWTYSDHGSTPSRDPDPEHVRNCLWLRVLFNVPVPYFSLQQDEVAHQTARAEKRRQRPQEYRSVWTVSHLNIELPTPEEKASSGLPFVSESVESPGFRVVLGIIVSEFTGILMAVGIALTCQSWWAIIFAMPLGLRLLSAAFALRREGLRSPKPESCTKEKEREYVISNPESERHLILITGPGSLLRQFTHNYGYPIRNGLRETIQMAIIILYACMFPVGLLCSSIWMSTSIQCAWTYYQVYIVIALHVARYVGSESWASTEEQLAAKLSAVEGNHGVLFGHQREASSTIKVTMTVTYHLHCSEAKTHFKQLMRYPETSAQGVCEKRCP